MKKTYYSRIVFELCLLLIAGASHADADRPAPWVGLTFAGLPCEGGQIHYGPFDYTSAARRAHQLPIVEEYHFTKEVQGLIKGKSGTLLSDIDYTLGAFPNHHKALNALTYFTLLSKPGTDIITPLECYFQKAINFAPKDTITYMLYASYLKKTKHYEEADKIYNKAIKVAPTDLPIRYSYGLFLLSLKKYAEAQEQAEVVYEKDYPKQKLKQKLMASGHWKK